jgi:V/A-type H+-transporting ATPase subunit K
MRPVTPRETKWLLVAMMLGPLVLALLQIVVAPALAQAFVTPQETTSSTPPAPEVMKWGFIAAALVTGLSALGAAYAVAVVGGAAMGAVAEKPETAGRALVFVGLAEGIAIYGLIVAIMILGYLT